MSKINNAFCPNKDCKDYGLRNRDNTSYVERSNLNWRMWDAHYTRKSLMFAKSFRWLKAKFANCVGFYNFIRPHETLSREADRIFRPRTPAMAAGVTDHQWTIKALLSYKACVN